MSDDAKWERELVSAFREANYGAMRAPASGSATAMDVADVMFATPVEVDGMTGPMRVYSELGVVEHKKKSDPRAYYTEAEVLALGRVAIRWGATPYLGARYTRSVDGNDRRHYLVRVEDAEQIDSGKYRVHADDAESRASIVVNASSGEVSVI